ncbi:MAG TPA: cytochrome P450 [Bradyrhizobium sp.]
MVQHVDFTSEAFFRNPAAGVASLRAAGPVVATKFPIIGRVWVTTTYETAARVLKDNGVFTLRKDGGSLAGLPWWMPKLIGAVANNMLTMDEPDHTRLRNIVDEAFRRRAVLDMAPHIRAIADGLADRLFADGSPADLVQRYARMLPLAVICELLGLPPADRPKFIAWANSLANLTNAFGLLRLVGGLIRMRRYLQERLRLAREEGGEGLIAELVRVEKEGGRITPDEMVSMVFLLLGAGSETTTHLISGSVFELLKDTGRRDWLAADWSRASLAVEEFLRFVSPVQFSKPRYVRHDVDIEGVKLKKGDRVMAMIVAANLDERANACPERLDLERRPNRHLSFGTGVHFCLGHQLARIEATCALQALFTRWPGLQLAVEPSQIRWRRRPGIRMIAKLPVVAGL